MKMRNVLNVLLMILFATSTGCATMESARHKDVYSGTDQGVKAGQGCTVYKSVRTFTSTKQQPAYNVVKLVRC
jgi:hypothetical protein